MEFKPGSLVKLRHRDWVILPSPQDDLLLLKPLGGSEDEITGVYLPLNFADDNIASTLFPLPTSDDIGDLSSARILFNATRLAFRNAAGPFRCLGKLSFRPRSYQMVPLIMALRQNGSLRLLIADDVGVGKTIEALLVLKELLERREINRFAIIALPHLCEQWQIELRDKFGIEAVIIRSNTQARLDREIPGDTSVYQYYPYQVISIDYIKSEQRREVFIQECPEFIIVDEAHTCSVAAGTGKSQQQRHNLIHRISQKPGQSLVLLTATPHSGKQEQFNSLLGLIDQKYTDIDLPNAQQSERKALAAHYIQRRRADVEKWLKEETVFPQRDSGEYNYELGSDYAVLYDDVLEFVSNLTRIDTNQNSQKRFRYWSALSLLRGIMSSPDAGIAMLHNRISNRVDEADNYPEQVNPVMDEDYGFEKDYSPTELTEITEYSQYEKTKLREYAKRLSAVANIQKDRKAAYTLEIIKQWINEKYNPVIFCRFIATANYLGKIIKPALLEFDKNIDVQVVTSEDPDDIRKSRIEEMKDLKRRVLIATDCLSEGINLQELFNAVLHYDLPWNPNRLEQREGRIDRFGQPSKKVKTYLLYGKDNPIDGVVLKVLLRKVREIRKSIGISIPFPEDSQSLMDAVLQAVLLNPKKDRQLALEFSESEDLQSKELKASKEIDKAAEREKLSRNIFAQHAIKDNEIEEDLRQADQAIGNPEAVESFVIDALKIFFGAQLNPIKKGYLLYTTNLPDSMKSLLPDRNQIKISFYSPVPDGYYYLGRNHPLVEQICQSLMANSLDHNLDHGPARSAVIKSKDVSIKTTLLLFRVRNVIEDKSGGHQIVAEEMLAWGYRGSVQDMNTLDQHEIDRLMSDVIPSADLSREAKRDFLENELKQIQSIQSELDNIARKRAEILIEAHERFRKVIGGDRYKVVEPVLPMDLMGMYILLPC